jgi:hypothetical protein
MATSRKPSANLRFLISTQNGLEARCTSCPHCKELDILALAVQFGETATLAELEPKLAKCPACGGRSTLDPVAKWLPPVR